MLYDIHHRYPQAYVHRHKLHVRTAPFKHMGQSEVTMLVKMVDQITVDGTNENAPTISIPNPSSSNNFEYTKESVYETSAHCG